MTPFNIFKGTTALAVGIGVNKIVKTIIDNQVFPETTAQKVLVTMGRLGMSMTASAIVVKHYEHQLDEYNAMYHKIEDKVKEDIKNQK